MIAEIADVKPSKEAIMLYFAGPEGDEDRMHVNLRCIKRMRRQQYLCTNSPIPEIIGKNLEINIYDCRFSGYIYCSLCIGNFDTKCFSHCQYHCFCTLLHYKNIGLGINTDDICNNENFE